MKSAGLCHEPPPIERPGRARRVPVQVESCLANHQQGRLEGFEMRRFEHLPEVIPA